MAYSYRIDPGPLTSISALYKWLSKPLHELSDLIREDHSVTVDWDLRSIEFRHINLAALTSFLATAYRVRGYLPKAPGLLLTWNPRVLGFLHDISFFEVAKQFDIFTLPYEIMDGFQEGMTNPNTGIVGFSYAKAPDFNLELSEWKNWKDDQRMSLSIGLLKNTASIFDSRNKSLGLPENAKNLIATSSAELILNSVLWGESPAFLGMQRSGRGISVVVADCGQGFLRSLHNNPSRECDVEVASHAHALIVASLINNREFGLKKVINLIVEHGGWVEMSTFGCELRWTSDSWNTARSFFDEVLSGEMGISELITESFGAPVISAQQHNKERGFIREWSRGIRGSRISFELPLSIEGRT